MWDNLSETCFKNLQKQMFLFSFLFSNVTFALFCCKQNNLNNSLLFPFASRIRELLHIMTKESFLASLAVAWITGSVRGCFNRTLGLKVTGFF